MTRTPHGQSNKHFFDYYAFGSGMAARTASFGGAYRFGMNTQEKEIELGEGVTSAEYWFYDGKLGRRWNLDVYTSPYCSDYSVNHNSPLIYYDPNGAWPKWMESAAKWVGKTVGKAVNWSVRQGTYAINTISGNSYRNKAIKFAIDNGIDYHNIRYNIAKSGIKKGYEYASVITGSGTSSGAVILSSVFYDRKAKFKFSFSGNVTAGAQAKVQLNIAGVLKAKLNVAPVKFKLTSWDVGTNGASGDYIGKNNKVIVTNSIEAGVEASLFKAGNSKLQPKIALGAYAYQTQNINGGWDEYNKDAGLNATLGVTYKASSNPKIGDAFELDGQNPSLKLGKKEDFWGLDLGAGAALIIGIDLNIKVGWVFD
jgi:hypothetical protein